jgi:hypothetical protein
MKNFTEALKEAGRVAVLAVLPIVIDSLAKGVIDWNLVGVTALIAVLRFTDAYLHNSAPAGVSGGLTNF